MSLSQATNNSAILQNALGNITSVPMYASSSGSYANGNSVSETGIAKLVPAFKLEMYKADNGGFVLNLIKRHPLMQFDTGKLFILKDIENLGKDIQYILATEVLKDC